MADNNIRKRAISPECENAKRQQLSRNDSESSSEDESEFGQKPPSLIDYIKGTLNNYPDGSQILKEIIQNADDAGATEVKFLLDYSTHSCDKIIHPVCSHYQGQALYSWNNAKFRTADWKGIQSVGVSGKAKESLKVGRFGLGFVAVYHITDVPIVLSDRSIGILDPQEQIFHRQPGRKFKLSKFFLDDKYSDQQSCFRSYFGYSGTGEYNGTIFRFPLRTEQCNSTIKPDGVYDAEKVKTTLFEALEAEADNVLIFLKRVKSIKLLAKDPLGLHSCYEFSVKIPDSYLTGVQLSNELLSNHVLNKQFRKSIKVTVNVFPISSTSGEKVWLVLNLIGFPQSPPTLSQFYSAKKLDYLPWIGIAMETGIKRDQLATSQTLNFTRDWDGSELVNLIESILSEMMLRFTVPFEHELAQNSGNLFCFLPTPEPSYLPFNLHGYFALSNDRRRIKWPSRDSDDTDSKWNELLIGQLAVSAFAIFYRILVHCFHHGDPEVYHYRLLGGETTDSHSIPSALVNQGLEKIVNDRIVYSHIINEWIRVDVALFHSIQYSINEYNCTQVKCAIEDLLKFLQEPLVLLPNNVLSLFNKIHALRSTMDKKRITPDILRQILKKHSNEELIQYFETNIATHTSVVLSYILSDLDTSRDDIPNALENIPLLLGASLEVFKFSINSRDPLYIYEKEMNLLNIFPGAESLFVNPNLPTDSYNCLLTISQRFFGRINIRDISKLRTDTTLLNQLFKLSLESHFKELTPPVHWSPNCSLFNSDWLKRVWSFIGSDSTLASSLGTLPLLPKGDILSANNQLLSIIPTVSSAEYILCSSEARYSSIENILVESGAVFIHSHRFIDCLDSLVISPLPNGLLSLLEKNSSILNSLIHQLNSCSDQELFRNVVDILNINHSFSVSQKLIVKQLPIFPNMIGAHISLLQSYVRVPDNINLPKNIQYPSKFLSPDSPSMSILFSKLVIPSLDINLFVRVHMIPFMESLCGDPNSFPNHFQLSKWLLILLDKLSPELIQFIKLESAWVADNSSPSILLASSFHKPSQLFDPDDETLKNLLLTNSRFFPHNKFETYFLITKKKQLFLTSTTLVDQLLFEEVIASAIYNFPVTHNFNHQWELRFSNLLTFINSCWKVNKLKIDTISQTIQSSNIVLPLFVRPDSFPECIPFLGDRTLCTPSSVVFCTREEVPLIASVRKCVPLFPTHDKFKDLLRYFNCQTSLTGDMILEQLTEISDSVIHENEVSEVHKILSQIYDSELILNSSLFPKFVYIKLENIFTFPKKVVKKAPFDMEPFFYSFNTLNYSENAWRLFEKHGACVVPSPQQLFDIIQHLYDIQNEMDHFSNPTNLIHNITNYLSERLDQIQYRSLLLLGEDNLLHPTHDCVYRDDNRSSERVNIDIDGKLYHIAYSSISIKVAEKFGARSLKYTLLSDDDDEIYGFCEAAGQYEDLTTRLNNILQQYASSIDVFKELVQNADDAKANSVRILIDYSSFPSESLLEHSMRHWQGPALYFYNDAQFTDADYVNILKIFGQTKRDNMFKIGKFGLGFNTVYHLTDLPSFVSGTYLYMLDPHKSYIAKRSSKPGIRVDFVKKHSRILLYSDQFSVFNIELFNCNVLENKEYRGTLFRLPFRTNSVHSDISAETYGDLKIQELKSLILKEAEATVRFLQHINCIEVFERDKERNISLVLKINKHVTSNPIADNLSFLSSNSTHFAIIPSGAPVDPVTLCQLITVTKELEGNTTSEDFIVTYSSGTKQCQAFLRSSNMPNLPFCSIALSTNTLKSGILDLKLRCQLYCFLPLPVTSPYPMFINGYFALDNSRRGLACTEDGSINTEWNKVLINDALVNALICLLLEIRNRTEVNQYYSLWPTTSDTTLWREYSKCTAMRIIESNAPLFLCNVSDTTEWLGYRECSFFDCENLNYRLVEDFFQFVRRFSSKIGFACFAILPISFYDQEVFSTIINHSKDKLYTLSRICSLIIFPNLEKMDLKNLKLVLSSLIPLAKGRDKPWIVNLFQSKPSIPCGTEHEWQHTYPQQIINPNSKLAKLYEPSDKRLPHPMFVNFFDKQNSCVFQGLVALNIIDKKLPVGDLIDRTACQTGFREERRKMHCAAIIEYLDNSNNKYTQPETQQLINAVNKIPFIPICRNEVFVRLGLQTDTQYTPPNACSAYNLGFAIAPDFYSVSKEFTNCKTFLELFSICTDKSEIQGETLTKIIENFYQKQVEIFNQGLTESVTSIVLSIYELLVELFIKQTPTQSSSPVLTIERNNIRELLCNKHWIWHPPSNSFCKMSQIVGPGYQQYNSKFLLCFPFNHLLEKPSYKQFFSCLGLQFDMTLNYVIDVISRMKNYYEYNPLSQDDIELVIDLIQKYFHSKDTNYSNLQFVLSANNVLCSTSELVRDDVPWKKRNSSENSKFPHPRIPLLCLYNLHVPSSRKALYKNVSFKEMDFGQFEAISTRIENLKREFPNDATILKEFLQNAEDAQATEFSVILDYKKDYKTESLCYDSIDQPNWCKYQECASLLIYNNKPFTAEDLEGIQSVGLGGKQNKQTIGKFGLGFNTVYHLTKSPCLLTKRKVNGTFVITYCVFDPYRKFLNLSRYEPPGVRLEFNDQDFMDFSDQFEPFLHPASCLDLSEEYTLFRIPFFDRTPESIEQNHIAEFLHQASKVTLFLRNICNIHFYKFDIYGTVSTIGSMSCQFLNQIQPPLPSISHNLFSNPTLYLNHGKSEFKLKRISSTIGPSRTTSTWLIYNFKGNLAAFETVCREIIAHKKKYENEKLTYSIFGGIAIEVPQDLYSHESCMKKSYLYSYLPIGTNLSHHNFPANINAPFILDSNRHYLRFQDSTSSGDTTDKQWHDAWHIGILKHVIVPMYALLLLNLKSPESLGLAEYFRSWEKGEYYNWYYSLFPDSVQLESRQTQNSLFLSQLIRELYTLLHTSNQCLLISEDFSSWFPFTGDTRGAFRNLKTNSLSNTAVNDEINSILAKIQYPITAASDHIAVNLEKFKLSFQSITQLHLLAYLNEHTHHLSKDRSFPTELCNSTLTLGEIICLLRYLLDVSQNISGQYQGIPLKVDSLGKLRNFSKSDPTFESGYSTLLTGCGSSFLNPKIPNDIVQNLIHLGYLKPLDHTFLAKYMNPIHFNLDRMALFWKFVLNCLPRDSSFEKTFGNMNVVPVFRAISSSRDYLKISQLPCILRRKPLYNEQILFNILSKLDCPILDLEIFLPKELFTLDAIKLCLDKYKFEYSSPQNIINALNLAISCSLSNKLDSQEAKCLRNVFLNTRYINYDAVNLKIISSLKMFVTSTNTLVSLNDCRICFISTEQIPIAYELFEHLSKQNVSILIADTDTEKTNTITTCRGCAKIVIDSYQILFCDYLLPKFNELAIPQQHSLLQFIQTIYSKDSMAYLHITERLKQIPFIQLPGQPRAFLVGELYDSNIELFRSFYSELLIPETWLRNNRAIMHKLGLHYQLDFKSIKECAVEVSTEQYEIQNSKTLLPLLSLIQLIKSSSFVNTINLVEFSNIHFLPLWRYTLTFQKEYKLGRFCDANLYTQHHCCSTYSWIHCPEIKISDFKPYTQCLGIITSPPTSDVLPHLIHISNNFNSMHQLDRQVFFESTYTYIQDCSAISLSTVSDLTCIFYDQMLYQTRNLVFEIRDEFKPFLCKVPPQLEKYKKFLTSLGVEQKPTYSHYAAVMKDIAFSNSPSTVERYGQMVFSLFISALRELESKNQPIQLNLSDTYVLTKNFTCIPRSTAIFIDNTKLLINVPSFSSLANFDYLFELSPNNHGSCEPPKSLSIKYLSSIIQESLTVRTRESLSIKTDTTEEIQSLLKSEFFYHGLVRIYYHSTKGKGKDNLASVRIKNGVLYDIEKSPSIANDSSYTSIKDILCQLVVVGVGTIEVEVSNLQNGEKLCRNDIYQCFMEGSRLYIQVTSPAKDLYCALTYSLNVYLCNIFSQTLFHLQACLISQPDKIPSTLNSYHISQCPYLNIMTPQNTPSRAPTGPTAPQLMTRDRLFQMFHRPRSTNFYPPSTLLHPTPSTVPIPPSSPRTPHSSSLLFRTPSVPTSPSVARTPLQRISVPPSSVVRTNTLPNSSHPPPLPLSTIVPSSSTLPSTTATSSCDEYTAKLWIRTAQCDLKAAQKLLHRCEDDQSIYTAHACFYCFECAIKSCISVICLKQCYQVNISYERNLDVIIDILKQFMLQDAHTQLFNICLSLMNYNKAARDPCMTPGVGCCIPIECYSLDAAEEAIGSATSILNLIKDKFPQIERLMFNDGDNVWEHPPIISLLKTHLDNIQIRSDGYYETLPEDCQEYYTVARNFFDCIPKAQIIKITKIHNQDCWKNFKQKVENKFQAVQSENYSLSEGSLLIKPLFHGSSNTDPKMIIENPIGFKVGYSRGGLWGRGIYFAVNAAYSHANYSYSVSKERHEYSMFLAKVFVGNSKKLEQDSSIQSPPTGYHTVNGVLPSASSRPATKAYILYEDGLAYPSYLINYRYNSN